MLTQRVYYHTSDWSSVENGGPFVAVSEWRVRRRERPHRQSLKPD